MAQTPEGKVKARAKLIYKDTGALYDRNAVTGLGQNGRSDDIVWRSDGAVACVEFKAKAIWKVSALQRVWLEARNAIGATTMVVNETNLDMLRQWLERPGTRVQAEFVDDTCVRHWAFVPGFQPFEIKNPTLPRKVGKRSH